MSGPTARGTAPGETPARAPGPGPDPGIGLDVVLLAGGAGVRLWPVSRARRPKQFFRFQGASLLEGAWARALRLAGGAADHVWAVLTDDLAEATAAELPQLVRANLVTEAARRNTAAAVGYAAVEVRRRRGPGAVLAVLPTDHHVAGAEAFDAAARRAAALAAEGYIVTIGVAPTRPETGFGWLEIGAPIASGPVSGSASGPAYGPASGPASGSRPGGARDAAGGPAGTAEPPAAFELARFVEKPARARAEEFLADPAGRFLWNGGMFFFRADRILAEIARQMPALASALDAIAADPSAAAARYLGLPADLPSIDYGVMEHAARLACVAAPPALGWSDVGSWAALRELLPPDAHGNVVHAPAQARVVAVDARNNLVHAPVRLVALLGVEGLSVVYEDGVLLVCPLDQSQRVRELVARVRADEELKEVL